MFADISKCPVGAPSDFTRDPALPGPGYSQDAVTAHGFRTTASMLLNGSGSRHEEAIDTVNAIVKVERHYRR